MKALVINDVHLRDHPSDEARIDRVARFLTALQGQTDVLLILGDLFDFYMGFPRAERYLTRFEPVLRALHELINRGTRVMYIEGNHDFHLGPLFTQGVGLEVFPAETDIMLDGARCYAAHGDLVNRRDRGYLVLRRVLRSGLIKFLMRVIPPRLIVTIARLASRSSRAYTARIDLGSKQAFRDFARQKWDAGYDVVLLGHNHQPAEDRVPLKGRTRHYYNLGVWTDTESPVLYWDGETFERRDASEWLQD